MHLVYLLLFFQRSQLSPLYLLSLYFLSVALKCFLRLFFYVLFHVLFDLSCFLHLFQRTHLSELNSSLQFQLLSLFMFNDLQHPCLNQFYCVHLLLSLIFFIFDRLPFFPLLFSLRALSFSFASLALACFSCATSLMYSSNVNFVKSIMWSWYLVFPNTMTCRIVKNLMMESTTSTIGSKPPISSVKLKSEALASTK